MAGPGSSYDEMPYDGGASAGSHPRRLAAIGHVFGMNPAPPATCRVLELGCAVGTNLINMAATLPGAEFVGIDLFESQVIQARQRAAEIGLRNIRFEAADIMEFGPGEKPFDYILACGVFSWVPEAVQERMLELCDELLARDGIAFITYNTLPGWYMRLPVRDLMLMASGEGSVDERVRVSAGILDFVVRAADAAADHSARGDRTFADIVKRERVILDDMPANYVAHEHLEANNRPIYFKDFVAMATEHGFQYLAESIIATMFPTELEPGIRAELDRMTHSQVGMEQLLDFIRGRQFRQTLLCRSDREVRRDLDALRLDGMYLSVKGKFVAPDDPQYSPERPAFRDGQAITRFGDPAMARVVEMVADAAPQQVRFEDALPPGIPDETRRKIEKSLITMYLAGFLRLDIEPTALSRVATQRPRASRAALATRSREEVTNLLHQSVLLSPMASLLFELLDGTRDRAALARDFRSGIERAPEAGDLAHLAGDPVALETAMNEALSELAEKALLEADD